MNNDKGVKITQECVKITHLVAKGFCKWLISNGAVCN